MRKNLLLLLSLMAITFLVLSFSEFRISRNQLLSNLKQPSPTILLKNYPNEINFGDPIPVTWDVEAPVRINIPTTAIYYDFESTPSAVTKSDHPNALGYQYRTSDYQEGAYPIPYTFAATLPINQKGILYFRAYAFVNGEHLWTPEYQVLVK